MESIIAGKYAVVEALGACPTGTRFSARHPGGESLVVVTALPDHTAEALAAVRRAAELEHEALAPVVEVVEADGRGHVIETSPEGDPLDRLLRDRGTLAPADALHVARHLAGALAHAHGQGVVHGALTPASVVVARTTPPRAWLAGLAAAPAAGIAERHVAPERLRGNPADARTDVFALGLLLFEMVEGRPFLPAAPDARERLLLGSGPLLPRFSRLLPSGVSALVAHALRLAPAQRFQTMDAMREAIEACLRRIGERRAERTGRAAVRAPVLVVDDTVDGVEDDVASVEEAPKAAPVAVSVANRRAPASLGRVLVAASPHAQRWSGWMPIGGFVALALLALGLPLVRKGGATVPAPAAPKAPAIARVRVAAVDPPPAVPSPAIPPAAEAAVEPALAPEPPPHEPLVNVPPRIVGRQPRAELVRVTEGEAIRFAITARDDDQLGYAWYVDGRHAGAGAAFRFTAPLAATGTSHTIEARVFDAGGAHAPRVAWTVEVRPRMSETNVRDWLGRLAAAWDRKDLSTLRLFGVVRGDGEAATVQKRFSRWGGYRVVLANPAIRTEGQYASVAFDASELDGHGRLLGSHRESYTLEKQAGGFVGLRAW